MGNERAQGVREREVRCRNAAAALTMTTRGRAVAVELSPPSSKPRPCRGRGWAEVCKQRGSRGIVVARRSAPDQSSVGISIENLTEDYCDDFVCTSSPAVETSVRQLAKGICTTAMWPPRNFAPKVTFSDGIRRFQGNDKYDRMTFLRDYFLSVKIGVDKMDMLDLDTAVIEWSLTGEHSLGTVNLECSSEFSLNVISGRVEDHKETWRVVGASPAAIAFGLTSLRWRVQQNASDAIEKIKDFTERKSSELESPEEYFVDPTDPKRYIQNNDTTFDDALQLGIVLSLLYCCVQVLRALEGDL